MKTQVMTINPKIASQMLKGNDNNRHIYGAHVDRLAAAILAGEWKVNGDAIRFNGDRLIDGQHRLHAVIKAGKPIKTMVITDLPSDVFDTIDVGKVRTTANTLQAVGEKNAAAVAAALRCLKGILMGNPDGAGKVSNTEIMQGLTQHPKIRDSVTFCSGKEVAKAIGRISVLSALHYLFAKKDAILADLFVSALDDGSGLMGNDPIYILRQKLIQNKLSPAKLSSGRIAAFTIKAWNSMRKGEKIKFLRVNVDEPFPTIF